ncbi:MAG TPA: sugar phosphate nucleotidyltransferase [Steroidobacteraceae bacterium]|nr:sugar phosphate nucleotidyltransferase [Steroidobacteraceae bacterium]
MNGEHVWSVVLAGGEGTRLRALTTGPCGTPVPKQFCSLQGGRTLLEDAIVRASGLVDESRICAIVAQQHRQWWTHALQRMPNQNIIVQPRNKGTAMGVLYSVLSVLARDPEARVLLLPADHYVRDELVLRQSLRIALSRLDLDDSKPVLLGLEPDEADPELGYILPGSRDPHGGRLVGRFVEKPTPQVAKDIIANGGLWNTFIIAASAQSLLNMYTQRFAPIVMEMKVIMSRAVNAGLPAAAGWAAIAEMYDRLPEVDFSRHLMEGRESELRVVRVPPCGWSDLGTPKRVAETVRRLQVGNRPHHHSRETSDTLINLAARHAHLERAALSEATF